MAKPRPKKRQKAETVQPPLPGIPSSEPPGTARAIETAPPTSGYGPSSVLGASVRCDNLSGLLRFAACLLDLLEVSLRPSVQRRQRLHERLTEWSQRIVHTRGNDRIDGSPYQPIALKRAQRLRQHLLGHSADRPTELAVPPGPSRQLIQDQQAPLGADTGQDFLDIDDPPTRCFRNHFGCTSPQGAYLNGELRVYGILSDGPSQAAPVLDSVNR